MTISGTHATTAPDLRDRLDRFFAEVGQGFNAYLESRGRLDEVRRLEAKTNAELEAMGLTRERVVHHVFRDLLHI